MDKQNPFNAIKVVECGEGVSAAFGAKLLADLGAEMTDDMERVGGVAAMRGRVRERFDTFVKLDDPAMFPVIDRLARPDGICRSE
jgi:crotonobetainyl-CoA:carnitine CoA-transferase CaiB-like acyl-CoA transferase